VVSYIVLNGFRFNICISTLGCLPGICYTS